VLSFYAAGYIEMIDYAKHKRKRVRYQSIVDFCDELRKRYCITDRRPPLANPLLRHRDADLLPFPIEDTLNIEQTAEILGYSSPTPVRLMIEEGRFEAYQFFPGSPWRVSKTSLAAYLERVRTRSVAANSKHCFSA
jgi:excisionase family DNA binding protein